jgi:hypothetical protein
VLFETEEGELRARLTTKRDKLLFERQLRLRPSHGVPLFQAIGTQMPIRVAVVRARPLRNGALGCLAPTNLGLPPPSPWVALATTPSPHQNLPDGNVPTGALLVARL